MHLPLIHPPIHLDICVIGDVTIHESAVVAPGTILQAAPDSRIVIKEGACLGMGTLLNAYQGNIEIESGAMLGAGVLIVGHSKIGKNACIGSGTTILNTSIEQQSVIKPGSLIGDTSRSLVETSQLSVEEDPSPNGFVPEPEVNLNEQPTLVIETEDFSPEEMVEKIPDSSSEPSKVPVVGQIYINQLLCTLFPERQAFERAQNNRPSES